MLQEDTIRHSLQGPLATRTIEIVLIDIVSLEENERKIGRKSK